MTLRIPGATSPINQEEPRRQWQASRSIKRNRTAFHSREFRKVASLVTLIICLSQTVSSFTPGGAMLIRPMHALGSTSLLHAKKAQAKSKKTKKSGTSSGGAGFGSSKQASPSMSGRVEGKVRSLSGFSGSGTKPLRQAANTFDAIREEYGKDSCWDLYCKSPMNDPNRLWFVGKVAVRPNTAATPNLAVLSQKRVILEYAKRELRPQNLGGKYADTLELWLAPGDSEMECVQNKVSLEAVVGSMSDVAAIEDFSVADVGYNPEIYVGDEQEKGGLRITRDENGDPINPVFEINQ